MPRRYYPRRAPSPSRTTFSYDGPATTINGMVRMHFRSGGEYAEWYKAARQALTTDPTNINPELQRWEQGGDDVTRATGINTALTALTSGDDRHLQRAQNMIDRFTQSIEVPAYTWELDVAGVFPDVPAYIANLPTTMWNRVPDHSDRSPIKVYVGLTSSYGISREQLTDRGCALAAFAIAMAPTRPVQIIPYVEMGKRSSKDRAIISWDVSTSPLVLAELMGALTMPEVTRDLGLAACFVANNNVSGHWMPAEDGDAVLKQNVDATDDDLFLPSISLYDPILTDPIKWIEDQIAKYSE